MASKRIKPWMQLGISLGLPLAVGALGGWVTQPAIATWYAGLVKPGFTPPNWVFGPVWTALYLLMGVALFLVWRKEAPWERKRPAWTAFFIQLALNLLWSFLFFGLRSPTAGLVEIAFLWVALLITIVLFYRISHPAGFLLVPYGLWVSYAAALNIGIAALNR